MYLKIVGCPDENFKPYLKKAAHFFAKNLFSPQLSPHIYVLIKFDKTLDSHGSCEVADYETSRKPREFLINMNPGIGAPALFRTLAHEMVHVKQFAYQHTNASLSVWHKKEVDSDNLDYWFHPWEIEAYGLETSLVTKFSVEEKLWEVFEEFKNPEEPAKYEEIKWKTLESTK
jgi:hypothetical protein